MTQTTAIPTISTARQTTIGLGLALAIVGSWLAVQALSVLLYRWSAASWFTAPLIVALITWLYVGLFIVAHDAMHGSIAPRAPRLNKLIGRACVGLYAGFDYDALVRKHLEHHRYSGTPDDPDFEPEPPHALSAWYLRFMREYMSVRQPAYFAAVFALYCGVLGAPVENAMAFIALPAILSSFQLFYFGTFRPHRPGAEPFTDRHRTRSSGYGWLASLLTCFHFGYHHEHHEVPSAPWWRLPAVHAKGSRG